VAEEPFLSIDHVQLAMPVGEEWKARAFYCDLLGMREVRKPDKLMSRGGAWFQSGDVRLHLGVEENFRPARKAHPAFRCADYEALVSRLRGAGLEVQEDENVPGVRRSHIFDCFGNRIELIAD
jgi:catechol 2,3-dioxygenase-like lactoylglutathione lyase family enzyme